LGHSSVDDRERWLDLCDERRDDVRGEEGVQRGTDEPRLGDAEHRQTRLDGVLAHHQHAAAARDPCGAQRVGDAVRAGVGLAVRDAAETLVGERARAPDDRVAVGVAPGDALQDVAHHHPVPAIGGPAVVERLDVEARHAGLRCGRAR
jgi:hypothetical protein